MIDLPQSDDLLAVARRVVWFKEPDRALAMPEHFLAHVMEYGSLDDIRIVRKHVSRDDWASVLDSIPPGILSPRTWSYWNVIFGRFDVPPMPIRQIPAHGHTEPDHRID